MVVVIIIVIIHGLQVDNNSLNETEKKLQTGTNIFVIRLINSYIRYFHNTFFKITQYKLHNI